MVTLATTHMNPSHCTHLLGQEGLDEHVRWRIFGHRVQPHDHPLRLQPSKDGEEGVDPLLRHERRLEDESHREEDDAVLAGAVEEVLQVLKYTQYRL